MTDRDPLSDPLARPGQTLGDHLRGVATAGATLIDGAGQTPYGDDWADVIRTLTWIHDIGKLTEYFQTYLETDSRTNASKPELTYHGRLGGFVTVLALAAQGMSKQTAAAGFFAVTKHHSVLPNMGSDIGDYISDAQRVDDRYEDAQKQLDNIDGASSDAADVVLRRATDGVYGWSDLTTQGLKAARKGLADIERSGFDESFYGCALRAWSTLVAADKADASGLASDGILEQTRRPDSRTIDATVRSISDTILPDGRSATAYLDAPARSLPGPNATLTQRLAALRTAANARTESTLREQHAAGKRVFELTLPTGFGKTYTGLRAALSLADHLDSRVIYAVPYTSIIDQVDEEVQDMFGLSPLDPEYSVHHHLADTRTVLNQDESPSTGRETMHAESWQSGLVLTTFTQLFESAAGPQNVQSMKLPALQDSVILIDEPQAISLDWWALVGRLTRHLTTEYNTTTIFMTATQPRTLSHLSRVPTPTPLVALHDDCVDLLNDAPRVEFELHESLIGHLDGEAASALSLKDAAEVIESSLAGPADVLAIVNTVGCASTLSESLLDGRIALGAELLDFLRETDGEAFNAEMYLEYLSEQHPNADAVVASLTTRLRPRDRRALLQCLDRILDDETSTPFDDVPTITVATQLIEAGVDLSFDQLYRDYGPIPSIVQAAGRCNRRFGGPAALVTVWRLDSPADDTYVPSELIYGQRSLLRPTKAAIDDLRGEAGRTVVSEVQMLTTGVETYYESLHRQRGTAKREDDLVTAFDQAQGRKLRNASVVSQDYPIQDAFVLVTDDETTTYSAYERYRCSEEWMRARQAFQALKPVLVSVPVDEPLRDDRPLDIRVGANTESYDLTTGQGVVLDGERGNLEM